MKIVKTVLHNCIGDQFMNDSVIFLVELDFPVTTPNDDVIDRFLKMKECKEQL